MANKMLERARLTEQERIELFTLLGQWSRNAELQAQKVTEWFERRQSRIARMVMEEAQIAVFDSPGDRVGRLRTREQRRSI